MSAKRRNDFPADRVTIMISAAVDTKLKVDLAHAIADSAKTRSQMLSTSYSRIINEIIKKAFEKGIDKKIIAAYKK